VSESIELKSKGGTNEKNYQGRRAEAELTSLTS